LNYLISILIILSSAVYGQAFPNGDFQDNPNASWLTDGPNTPKLAQGDGPWIAILPNGNRYAHVGDEDGIGAHGENPSRIFQWFTRVDTISIGPHCRVSFRFRSLLLPGETAWVRMKSPTQQSVWAIPNANNQWAAGVRSATLPNECGCTILLEFGVIKQAGGNFGGRLNIDDVEFRCYTMGGLPPPAGNWNHLPPIPDQDSSRVVPNDQVAMMTMPGNGNLAIALLLVFSILVLIRKLRRS
jgi:hypothetical protein